MAIKCVRDFNLVDRYLSGDKNAGEILFAEAYSKVKAYVLKETKDSVLSGTDKDDVVAESLSRLVDKLGTYNGQSTFASLSIAYAKNIIKEKYRKKGIENNKIIDICNFVEQEELENLESINLIGKSPERVLIEKENKETVQKAINMLSDEQQQILMLRINNDVSYKKIGEFCNKSEDAVRKMFGRSIIKLKENLKNLNF